MVATPNPITTGNRLFAQPPAAPAAAAAARRMITAAIDNPELTDLQTAAYVAAAARAARAWKETQRILTEAAQRATRPAPNPGHYTPGPRPARLPRQLLLTPLWAPWPTRPGGPR